MTGNRNAALQGDGGEVFGFGVDDDLVDDVTGDEVLDRPLGSARAVFDRLYN